jgi:hypothetical protein
MAFLYLLLPPRLSCAHILGLLLLLSAGSGWLQQAHLCPDRLPRLLLPCDRPIVLQCVPEGQGNVDNDGDSMLHQLAWVHWLHSLRQVDIL